MGVMLYAEKVMDSQDVTINQIRASLGRSKERIDAEFVKIEAAPLIDENTDITDAQIQQQFDAYKASVPGNPTDDNPRITLQGHGAILSDSQEAVIYF